MLHVQATHVLRILSDSLTTMQINPLRSILEQVYVPSICQPPTRQVFTFHEGLDAERLVDLGLNERMFKNLR